MDDEVEHAKPLPDVLLAALEQTRSPTCITTADLDAPGPTIVYVNPAYCAMTGRSRASVIGSSPRIMQGPLTDRNELDRLRADLEAGRPFEGETVNYRQDGSPFLINWRIDPVRDGSGEISHFVATQSDVTELRRTERLLRAEQDLDTALRDALRADSPIDEKRQTVLDVVVAGVQGISSCEWVEASATIEGVDYRAGAAPDDQRARDFLLGDPNSPMFGTITIGGLDEDRVAFLDVDGLERFVRRASTVLTALLEYQHQRGIALRLQRDLLPRPATDIENFSIRSHYEPGSSRLEVGGDWFDVVATEELLVLSVGDVAGSGAEAAVMMGRLRLMAEVAFRRGAEVHSVFEILDNLCREHAEMATMLVVSIDRATGRSQVDSAGHLPPIRFGAGGAELVALDPLPPLGYLRSNELRSSDLTLEIGDGMLLFTDGLVERRDEAITSGLTALVDRLTRSSNSSNIATRVIAEREMAAPDDTAVLSAVRMA